MLNKGVLVYQILKFASGAFNFRRTKRKINAESTELCNRLALGGMRLAYPSKYAGARYFENKTTRVINIDIQCCFAIPLLFINKLVN